MHRITAVAPLALILAAALPCPAAAQNVVTVTATEYALEAPDTIPAGWTTFRFVNEGDLMHVAQVVRLEDGHTMDDYARVYREAWKTDGPRPVWGIRSGGPGADGHSTSNATVHLAPGSYGLYCVMDTEDGVPHVFGRGMMRELVVVPGDGGASPPKADVTLTMTDYAFGLSAPLEAGRQVIHVVNEGVEPHEVALLRIPAEMTEEEVRRGLEQYLERAARAKSGGGAEPGPPPPDVESVGGMVALAHGLEGYFEVDLEPGAYVLLCFVTAPDGRPHVAHGMMQYLRVS